MAGFGVQQEPFFTDKLNSLIDDLLMALKDPALPLMETKELLSTISSRIPPTVDKEISTCLARYASNMTSVIAQFPTTKIENIINRHAASLQRRADHDQFFMNTNPIMQLVQKYVLLCVPVVGGMLFMHLVNAVIPVTIGTVME